MTDYFGSESFGRVPSHTSSTGEELEGSGQSGLGQTTPVSVIYSVILDSNLSSHLPLRLAVHRSAHPQRARSTQPEVPQSRCRTPSTSMQLLTRRFPTRSSPPPMRSSSPYTPIGSLQPQQTSSGACCLCMQVRSFYRQTHPERWSSQSIPACSTSRYTVHMAYQSIHTARRSSAWNQPCKR